MRRVLALACALVATTGVVLAGTRPASAASTTETKEPVRRVLMLSMPGVSYRDLDVSRLPNLRGLLEASGLADLSARGVHRRPTLGDGYVTIGAGARALGHPADDGQCLGAGEPFEDGTAREAMARRSGEPVASIPPRSVVCLAQPAITVRNSNLLYDAEIGGLAKALAGAGVHRAVIGNADRALVADASQYIRPVGLALAAANGVVPGGAVDSDLVTRDARAPFGVEADNDAYFDTFAREWKGRSVVVVEASDLARFDGYRSSVAPSARAGLQMQLLAHFDDLVGRLLARVDPARDAVMIVGPTPLNGTARLTMATLRAPGFRPGLMVSAYTRHSGLVSIVDVAPTVLDLLGIDRPSEMEGRPFEYGRPGATSSSASAG